MPRKRRTMSGADAQNIGSVPGQRYGEGQMQQQLQQDMPAPDTAGTVGPGGDSTVPMPQAPIVTGPPAVDPSQVGGFLSQHNPNLLGGSARPDEPVTAGLPFGPGAGSQALKRSTTPMSRYLSNLASDTGNPKWKRLAERAGLNR